MTRISSRRSGTLGWFDLALVLVAVLLLPGVASSSDLGDNYYADSSYHNWMEGVGLPIEQTIYEYYVDNRMSGAGGWLSTDLSGAETTTHHSGSSYVDAYWWMSSLACHSCGYAWCNVFDSSTICDHTHIQFDSELAYDPDNQQLQGACHELGHSIGFPDGGHTGGCMGGGTVNGGALNTHEITDVNAKW